MKLDRSDKSSMLIALCALMVMPLGLVLTRPRVLSAQTSAELLELTRTSRENQIMSEMSQRCEAVSLNFDAPETESNADEQWREIQSSMQNVGAKDGESEIVTKLARENLSQKWPIFVERAYLGTETVWLVCGGQVKPPGLGVWICRPSEADLHRAKVRKYCSDIQIAIIRSQAPHTILK